MSDKRLPDKLHYEQWEGFPYASWKPKTDDLSKFNAEEIDEWISYIRNYDYLNSMTQKLSVSFPGFAGHCCIETYAGNEKYAQLAPTESTE